MSVTIYDGNTLYTDSGTSNYFRKAIEAACAITNSCALPVVELKIL